MEGDVFQPGGTVSGGRSQKSGRVLEMKAQVARLEEEADKAQRAAESLSKKYKEAEGKELAASAQKEEYTRKIREVNGKIAVIEDQKESIAKEQRRAAGERGRILDSIKSEGKSWSALLAAMDELEEKRDRASDVEDDRHLIEEREKCRARATVAASNLSAGFALMNRVSNDVRAQESKLRKLEEETAELDQSCVRERSNLARVGGSCLEIHLRRKELLAEIEEHGGLYTRLEKIKEYIKSRQTKAESRMQGESEKFTLAQAARARRSAISANLSAPGRSSFPIPAPRSFPATSASTNCTAKYATATVR
ncbi:MAG: hypothetical protein LIO38_05985 [Cloacibacillus sp.]|nr:hypothetical protein [Cloacibacillus sp.]